MTPGSMDAPTSLQSGVKSWQAYLLAAAVTAATLWFHVAMDGLLGERPTLVILTLPIMLSAYLGGWWAGLLATALTYFWASYYVLPPIHSFAIASEIDRWQQFLVVFAGVFISAISGALHRSRRRADITRERERLAAARLDALVEFSDDAIVTKDLKGTVTGWNPGAEQLFGYSASEMIGRSITRLIPPERREEEAAILERIARGDTVRHFETVRVRKDGSRLDISVTVSAIRNPAGTIVCASKVARDITGRKQTEAALRESGARLEAMSRRLLQAQEIERRAIARELHDEVGGVLTAVKLNLLSLQGKRAGAAGDAVFADSLALIGGAIQTVRSISLDLRPAVLDDLGLIPALKWYCERQAQRAGIAIELALDAIDLQSAPQLESACFRIAQESLTNALRHAHARRIQVALRRTEAGIELEIVDDGGGFEVAAAHRRGYLGESSGLLGMQERAKLIGGRLSIDSTPGAGSRVRAEFAVPEGGFA